MAVLLTSSANARLITAGVGGGAAVVEEITGSLVSQNNLTGSIALVLVSGTVSDVTQITGSVEDQTQITGSIDDTDGIGGSF